MLLDIAEGSPGLEGNGTPNHLSQSHKLDLEPLLQLGLHYIECSAVGHLIKLLEGINEISDYLMRVLVEIQILQLALKVFLYYHSHLRGVVIHSALLFGANMSIPDLPKVLLLGLQLRSEAFDNL